MLHHKYGLKEISQILFIFTIVLNSSVSTTDPNITINAFGGRTDALPVAYGDFNSDEQTDIFVLSQEQKVLVILLGRSDSEPLV